MAPNLSHKINLYLANRNQNTHNKINVVGSGFENKPKSPAPYLPQSVALSAQREAKGVYRQKREVDNKAIELQNCLAHRQQKKALLIERRSRLKGVLSNV